MYPPLNIPTAPSEMYAPSNFNVIFYPSLPAYIPLDGDKSLEPGSRITILGRCEPGIEYGGTEAFRVDFFNGYDIHSANEIIFHFNPRFENGSGFIVMNSCYQGEWDQEIRPYERPFPFRPDSQFCLTFDVESEQFVVKVNDEFLCIFRHRYSTYNANRMHINGRLRIDRVKFEMIMGIQPRFIMMPMMPHFEYHPELGERPYDIAMTGTVRYPFNEYFAINLAASEQGTLCSESEFRNIPFHMSIRAMQQQIVRNTMIDGEWGEEETDLNGPFEFNPGQGFFLMISIRPDCISVRINGHFGFMYRHRISWQAIDCIQVYGSADLSEIRLQPV